MIRITPVALRTRLALACLLFMLGVPAASAANQCIRSDDGSTSQCDGEDGYRLLELDGYKVKWGDQQLGVGASISYAFAGETLQFDDALNCHGMAPIEALSGEHLSMETLAREAAAAFRVWERAAGLSFRKVGDARDADIVIGAQDRPRGRAFASVSYAPGPEGGVRAIKQALVCLNPDHKWKVGFDGDEDVYDIRYTLVHEIGHAIGLDHPGPSGQVMAFRYTEDFHDLQPGDLRGVQLLYGPAADDGGLANGLGSTATPVVGVGAFLGIGEKDDARKGGLHTFAVSNLAEIVNSRSICRSSLSRDSKAFRG